MTLHGRVDERDADRVPSGRRRRRPDPNELAFCRLSGALADCIAFGVPTVTTQDIADEMNAPRYVVTTGSATSSLLIAEAIDGLT